jgi:hypothetical protein
MEYRWLGCHDISMAAHDKRANQRYVRGTKNLSRRRRAAAVGR